jgi:CRP/FNR family transcriptional regulator
VKIDKFGLNKDQIVRIGSRSDLIGYRALIANEVYSATAEALEDTEVCFIPKSSFLYFINKDKEFSLELMRILSQDVKNAERNSMNIAQRTVMERLAEYLILMHEKLSKDANAQDVFSYSRKDLSDIIGCAPETLIRSLSALKNDEIISIVKKDIKVVDIQRLHRIANVYRVCSNHRP